MLNNQGYKGVSLGIRKNDTKLKKEKELFARYVSRGFMSLTIFQYRNNSINDST